MAWPIAFPGIIMVAASIARSRLPIILGTLYLNLIPPAERDCLPGCRRKSTSWEQDVIPSPPPISVIAGRQGCNLRARLSPTVETAPSLSHTNTHIHQPRIPQQLCYSSPCPVAGLGTSSRTRVPADPRKLPDAPLPWMRVCCSRSDGGHESMTMVAD